MPLTPTPTNQAAGPSRRDRDNNNNNNNNAAGRLLGKHVLDLLLAEGDVVDRLSSRLQGDIVAVEVGRQKDFGVPDKALAGREVRDLRLRLAARDNLDLGRSQAYQAGRAIGLANVDDGALLLGKGAAWRKRSAAGRDYRRRRLQHEGAPTDQTRPAVGARFRARRRRRRRAGLCAGRARVGRAGRELVCARRLGRRDGDGRHGGGGYGELVQRPSGETR
jgi:hypothetical protein